MGPPPLSLVQSVHAADEELPIGGAPPRLPLATGAVDELGLRVRVMDEDELLRPEGRRLLQRRSALERLELGAVLEFATPQRLVPQ